MSVVIKVENLSKQYRLGVLSRKTLTHDLQSWWARKRGKDDPNAKLHQRTVVQRNGEERIWALKDVSFEVKEGEVLGIIGKNGAGKSTLLKILSRVTAPTSGDVKVKGRVASLLEVGTGFHPELTGRENIYLNGAILGMKREEITRKFDEIVDFAGVEQFIDTPVKRYSSGMHVRLAFAVAAHLQAEILVVDEVLAVGDAEYQRKCLGKMGEVSKQGRTVLFVSHNMGSISKLCQRAILVQDGEISLDAQASVTVEKYLSSQWQNQKGAVGEVRWDVKDDDRPKCKELEITYIQLINSEGILKGIFHAHEAIYIEIGYKVKTVMKGFRFNVRIYSQEGEVIFAVSDHNARQKQEQPGNYRSVCRIPSDLFNQHRYQIGVECDIPGYRNLIPNRTCIGFSVIGPTRHGSTFGEQWPGTMAPYVGWKIESVGEGDFLG